MDPVTCMYMLKKIPWCKLVRTVGSFLLAFTCTFAYLAGMFTISYWIATAVSSVVALIISVGVMSSVSCRASMCVCIIHMAYAFGRFTVACFLAWLTIGSCIHNIVANLEAIHTFFNCSGVWKSVETEIEYHGTIRNILSVSELLYYGMTLPITLVWLYSLFYVIKRTKNIRGISKSEKTFGRVVFENVLSHGNAFCVGILGTLSTAVYVFNYVIAVAISPGKALNACVMVKENNFPSYKLGVLYMWFLVCLIASGLTKYLNSCRGRILSCFYSDDDKSIKQIEKNNENKNHKSQKKIKNCDFNTRKKKEWQKHNKKENKVRKQKIGGCKAEIPKPKAAKEEIDAVSLAELEKMFASV